MNITDLLVPIAVLCLHDVLNKTNWICPLDFYTPQVVKYDKPDPDAACYKDGIFYPRCKDLENPEVWHYHKLLSNH